MCALAWAPGGSSLSRAQIIMPSNMTAEAFVEKHGGRIVKWLHDNTVDCACDQIRFGPDEKLQRFKKEDKEAAIDVTTVISCRRCYVPVGLHEVCLHSSPVLTSDSFRRSTMMRCVAAMRCICHLATERRVP